MSPGLRREVCKSSLHCSLSLPLALSPSQVGRFLGEVDGALMTQLLSMGVFSQ